MNYTTILEECAALAKDRQAQYGEATVSMQLACDILESVFGTKLTVKQFCEAMISLKLSRLKFDYKEDSMIDIVNYICIAVAHERKKK